MEFGFVGADCGTFASAFGKGAGRVVGRGSWGRAEGPGPCGEVSAFAAAASQGREEGAKAEHEGKGLEA